MKFVKLLIVLTIVILVGCITTSRINWDNAVDITKSVKIEYDEFKKATKYVGPDYPGNLLGSNVFLRAYEFDSPPETLYQIYVHSYYSGRWRFYDRAYDSDGNRLKTVVISRDVGSCNKYGCSHHEHIGVLIDRKYLEEHSDTGIRFKVEGKGGQEIFTVPAMYINGFLSLIKA